ncbi:MAG: glycosyltransferase family 2 protein [Bacilli bacterium]|nr:glycosyltransferase family 2 protein [Bacilli bacterium]
MKVLMIIPAYNEEKNIVNTVNNLRQVKIDDIILDYIVINDGSQDGTRDVLEKNNIKHIDLPCNLGIGGAVQTGYEYALYNNYDIAIQFDGDGQHNPKYIKDLIEGILLGNDFVIGSRFINNASTFKSTAIRRVGINFLSLLIKICTNKKITDPTSGFRACNKKIIKLFVTNYPLDYPEPDTLVMLLKNNYKVLEIPVDMNERSNGKSSITALKSIYYMIKVSLSIIITSIDEKGDV